MPKEKRSAAKQPLQTLTPLTSGQVEEISAAFETASYASMVDKLLSAGKPINAPPAPVTVKKLRK